MQILFILLPFPFLLHVDRLTAEDVPGHELDISIRSKEFSSKEVARVLRERLNYENPNVQMLNGGNLIQLELSRREFMEAMYELLESKTGRSYDLRQLVLKLVQEWAELFRNNPEMGYVSGIYARMKRMGYAFSKLEVASGGAMIDSASAPEWEDSPVCQRCRTTFTFTNRKHHCRHCGKCFCKDCSSNTTTIPKFAIYDPVRVCHGCYLRLKNIVSDSDASPNDLMPNSKRKSVYSPVAAPATSTPNIDEDDEDLKRAIELSLQESQKQPNYADYTLNPRIVGGSAPISQSVQFTQPVQSTQSSTQSMYPSLSATSQAPANKYSSANNEPYPLTSAPTNNIRDLAEEDDPDLRAAIEASLRDVPGGNAGNDGVAVPDYLSATVDNNQQATKAAKENDTDDNAPLSAFMPAANIGEDDDSGPLSETERENIQLFESLLIRIRDSGQDVRYDPQIQYLHESIGQLHPRITEAMDGVDQKQKEFSKLHDRILTAIKIYDQLLDKRLRPSTYFSAGIASVVSTPTYQNTQQSIYPALPTAAQQAPSFTLHVQSQYSPMGSAPYSQPDQQQYYQQPPAQQQVQASDGTALREHYSTYNEPQRQQQYATQISPMYNQARSSSAAQSQAQLSSTNPFVTSASLYPAPSVQPVAPADQQPQAQAQAQHIPPLLPTPVKSVGSAQTQQMTAASSANINTNTNENTSAPEPEEALLIEF
ncbi:hypothetical protein BX070DRAFT_223305 [Coemansia spiralis]|nr:hypothetical protein BX070DRAFT_223305 [Coemansia spiralis]